MTITWKGSPNFNVGRYGHKPIAIVVHIMDGSLVGTDNWFNTPSSQVSAHYGVGKGAEIHQYVLDENTAWHAGGVLRPSWQLVIPGLNPNLYTLGIEHEGHPGEAWPDVQKQASATLIRQLATKWSIPVDRNHIIGHYEIFAGKPNCPAINKEIIDELIQLASVKPVVTPPVVAPIQSITQEQASIIQRLINLYKSLLNK